MQDRDGCKERHRAGRASPVDAPRRRFSITRVVLLVGLVVLAYWIGLRQGLFAPSRDRYPVASSTTGLDLQSLACSDAFPAADTVFGGPQWPREAAGRSKTTFSNRTAADRVVDLLLGDRLLASVVVPAHADAVITLPVGAFDWRLRTGAAWCNGSRRFVREQRTVISPPLEIVASSRLTVEIAPDPDEPTGFALRTRDVPVVSTVGSAAAPAATGHPVGGVLRVPRSDGGHYFIEGAVDNEPVRFMIDTGATRIALPVTLARRLGYYEGREVTVQTAAGQTTGSEFKVRRISFGPFVAEDVIVVALMNLETPLLGMSLLQAIEMRQTPEGLELRHAR